MIEYPDEQRKRENAARAVAECREEQAALAELAAAEELRMRDRLEACRLINSQCYQDGA
jgi:hypothetical protein